MKLKRFFAFSFVLSTIAGLTLAFSNNRSENAIPVHAVESSYDFSSDVEVGEDLSVNVSSASKTDFSTTYTVKFSTGGTAFYDVNSFVNVLSFDDALLDFYNNEFKDLTAEEKTKMRQEVASGERSTLVYDGYVHSFRVDKNEIYIPRSLSRGTYNYDAIYTINLTSIASGAFRSNAIATKLYIPKEIENIPSDALVENTKLTDIYLEATSIPAGFEAGWNGTATIHTGQNIYSGHSDYERASTVSTAEVGDPNINYILGYYPKEGEKTPLVLEYQVGNEVRFLEMDAPKTVNPYYGVGKDIAAFSTTIVFNIEHSHEETVNHETLKIHGIRKANKQMVEEVAVWTPDQTNHYFAHANKTFSDLYDLNSFIKISFEKIATFGGYTSIITKVDEVDNGIIYKTLKPSFYKDYEARFANGSAKLRFRVTGLFNTKYHVYYGEKQDLVDVVTPIGQYIFNKTTGNNFAITFKNDFVSKDFNPNDLKAFSLNNAAITIDIVSNGTILTKTAATVYFGSMYLYREQAKNMMNLDLILIITAAGYLVAAAALSTFLFFYFKKKYRNDEFKRLKPKQFIKKCIIYSLTSLVVVLAIMFVVFRATVFANAVVVYNPLDVFIIFFGIATVIIIGYYIKNLVAFSKANSHRKKVAKLGLNKDVADDGTK